MTQTVSWCVCSGLGPNLWGRTLGEPTKGAWTKNRPDDHLKRERGELFNLWSNGKRYPCIINWILTTLDYCPSIMMHLLRYGSHQPLRAGHGWANRGSAEKKDKTCKQVDNDKVVWALAETLHSVKDQWIQYKLGKQYLWKNVTLLKDLLLSREMFLPLK